ncbi:MAG: lasso peptide [Cyanobacteria bacterium P01_A01_bin.40]
MKKAYNRPQLTVHGNIETLTQATSSGSVLDASIPAGTPVIDLPITLS